ncbi:MAG: L-lactate dehydrogenase complex protein LldG [Sulfurimonas sp.]|jgi:L-lactate dehydrogenase complex protein LldG
MKSRDYILNTIRNTNIIPETPCPECKDIGIVYEDKLEQFSKIIKTVGGEALVCKEEDLDKTILSLYKDEKVISCNVDGCSLGNFDENIADPHDLKNIDLAIVKGEFAVAENGSVWIKNEKNKHRVLYFIAQNIVIVVPKNKILNNMHEAYENIDFSDAGFGAFVSGPSKTADIEQALVIGAHGPKSGYVIFID